MTERPFSVAFLFGASLIAVCYYVGFVRLPEWTLLNISLHVLGVLVCIVNYVNEYLGFNQLSYSKFSKQVGSLNARLGWTITYAMPAVTYDILWFIYGKPSSPFHFIALGTYNAHFIKRILECLFVHKYSRNIEVMSVIQIGAFYTLGASVQHYWCNVYTSANDGNRLMNNKILLIVGFVAFIGGEFINFYHHALLASLRPKGSAPGNYVVPSGGLFDLLVCPHYFGEIIGWFGMAILGQHSCLYLSWLSMVAYLAGRSHQTREWYLNKLDHFPRERKNLFPYIY
ncbi:steroid 5-alpha-reductase DET2-like [Actinia tenebrosa]|uniref:Steroid 5-alpha-reductase DET2-like n=1 Tax=Actinia tenebrosa TaxID=6105 RepID=A0A6P8HLN3_ACTTE|nr:steroid 5-alpha-reductase DET2-like [Actinia tenebrosa]